MHLFAAELQSAVSQHRTGKKPGFEQHLKPVADSEDGTAAGGERLDLAHDRREARHRAGPKVVAVGEAARQNDDVSAFQIGVLVPDVLGGLPEHVMAA